MRIIKPPFTLDLKPGEFSIFLAGSIEMNTAEDWQTKVEEYFADEPNIVLLNPRRDDWNSSWEQSLDCPEFVEQVEWELKAQERANVVMLYFDPSTKSPISLLELGLFKDKMIVCCPEDFWRKGNVDVVCQYYGTPQYPDLENLCKAAFSLSL